MGFPISFLGPYPASRSGHGATGSDIERSSVSEDQTEVNIRERAGGRKQKSFRTYMVVRVDPDQVLELR